MGNYEILPRNGECALRVNGKNLKELFGAALLGMSKMMKEVEDDEMNGASIEKNLTMSAPESTLLLIDFLSKVLSDSYEHDILYTKVKFERLDEISLKAKLYAMNVDFFDQELRGINYDRVEIKKNEAGLFESVISFDV